MALPFSACPFVQGFTSDIAQQRWEIGQRRLNPAGDLLIYHEGAEACYEADGVMLHAFPGSVVVLPKACAPRINVIHGGTVLCIGFYSGSESVCNLSLIQTAAPTRLHRLFNHFFSVCGQAPTSEHLCAMLSDFYTILYELQSNTSEGVRNHVREERIRPSVAYLESHIDEKKLNLKQIAALSHVSETHFRTLFRECYGCTPLQYLIDLRVQKALRLLKETDLPLSEIERQCGFRDHAYFVKQFQKITESSPEDYRAKKK